MKARTKKDDGEKLSDQIKRKVSKPTEEVEELNPGNFDLVISTGSTLLDLAISGNRIRGGGLPAGIVVEAFGPSQSGKTSFLCEVAGEIMRKGGEAKFADPEARLDQEFGSMFGMKIPQKNYSIPDTVTEVFTDMITWEPNNTDVVNGYIADSLAALSTKMEMEEKEGDKMGMRRAKEFSEQLRKSCRLIKNRNLLMVCSNQVRINADKTNPNSPKYVTPGGEAFKFYSSVRLRFNQAEKIDDEILFKGKKLKQVIGIRTEIEVVKTVDTPFRKAPIIILYGYGIDDVRANLEYCKKMRNDSMYMLGDEKLKVSLEESIQIVESDPKLIKKLKNETIDLWEEIRDKFATNRVKVR